MTALDVVARPIARAARLPLLAPLAVRDFRLVWAGESISLLGDAFQTVAVSWLVLGLTGSGLALGAILVAAAIPRGIFMLLGGVLADRISPRDLALGSNVLRAVLTTIVAFLVLGSQIQIWHLVAVGVVFGTVDAVFLPAINTLVPRLVPPGRLAAANALMQGTAQLMGTVGPAIAGFTIALIGVGVAFVIDAASFAIAALALWLVRSGATAGSETEMAPEPAIAAAAATVPVPEPSITTDPDVAESLDRQRAGRGRARGPRRSRSCARSSSSRRSSTWPSPGRRRSACRGSSSSASAATRSRWVCCSRHSVPVRWSAPCSGALSGAPASSDGWSMGWSSRWASAWRRSAWRRRIPVAAVILLVVGVTLGYTNVVMVAFVQEKTDPLLLGRTMSFLMLGSVVAAPLSLALAAVLVDTVCRGDVRRGRGSHRRHRAVRHRHWPAATDE